MSADEIDTVVLLFPNAEWSSTATDAQLNVMVEQLQPNISFALYLSQNIRTLSTHVADASGVIGGFLYVPDLNHDDPCYEISQDYVPKNATRQANLPPADFTLIALAPWINPECTQAYLAAARQDPLRAFIVYLPDHETAQPPPMTSAVWSLGDGDHWKSANPYPVYAVPGAVGAEMMHQLSLYSGNMTSVPYGHQISDYNDPRDYVRLYSEIHVSYPSQIPSLWVLLLIVIAVLFTMVGATSATMRLIQRSRRKSLRRRVASGEVNLEALGIKRLTVPQEFINRLPLFTYCEEEKLRPPSQESKRSGPAVVNEVEHGDSSEGPWSNARYNSKPQDDAAAPLSPLSAINETRSDRDSIHAHKYLPYSQPNCPICLDAFECGATPIRELPCGHIFHPECIDSFLGHNSSLCPLCKESVLPNGYCPPKITNAMVRRERNIRRLRSMVIINDEELNVASDNVRRRIRYFRSNVRRIIWHSTSAPREDPELTDTMPMESQPEVMTNAIPVSSRMSLLGSHAPENLGPRPTDREIALQNVRELSVGQSLPEDPEVVNEHRRPNWRTTLSKAFPGLS